MFSPLTARAVASIPPPPVTGVNEWAMSAARRCALAGLTQPEAFVAIMEAVAGRLRAGRELSRKEVDRAIATAYGTPHQSGGIPRVAVLTPSEIARDVGPPATEEAAQAFFASSPCDTGIPTGEILRALHEPESWLGFKWSNDSKAKACRVRDFPALLAASPRPYQFFTASPITGCLGQTQDGGASYVAKGCFPDQRFVVVEFDSIGIAEQVARILFLKRIAERHAPLVMVLSSGGKSLHSHFMPLSVEAADALKIAAFKLGADPAACRINQLVRLPGQLRDNGQTQSLLYLAPVPRL